MCFFSTIAFIGSAVGLLLPDQAYSNADIRLDQVTECVITNHCKSYTKEQAEGLLNSKAHELKNYKTSKYNQPLIQLTLGLITPNTSKEEIDRRFAMVERLMKNGANIDEIGDQGLTALHDASMFGNLSVVEFLLKKGAAPSVKAGPGAFEGKDVLELAQLVQKKKPSPARGEIIALIEKQRTSVTNY